MASSVLRPEPASLREQLTAMIPGLEIVLARALGPDDARDALQEVLVRALAAIDENRPIRESLAAFVRGIAMHVVADTRAERLRMPLSDEDADTLAGPAAEPLQLLIEAQQRRAMDAAVARLDPEDRSLLRRCFVFGEKTSDIARSLGEPASRVRKRKSRALQQLRALLGPDARDGHTLLGSETTKS